MWTPYTNHVDLTAEFAEGGFITWDKKHKTLVRLHYNPFAVEPFGTLPVPEFVTLRRDDAGLWAVVRDQVNKTLVVYEVDAGKQSVDVRMTVPVGGTYQSIAMFETLLGTNALS